MEIHPLTSSGVGPSTIVHPHVIVIKEDPDWKISKNNGCTSDLRIKPFFLEIEEEPELEIAVSVGGEFEEDPLKIPSNENEETSTIEEPSFDNLWQISNSEDEQHSVKEEYSCDEEVLRILSRKQSVRIKEELDIDLCNKDQDEEETEAYADIDDEEQEVDVNIDDEEAISVDVEDDNEEVQLSPISIDEGEEELIDTEEEQTISTEYSSPNKYKVDNEEHSLQNRKRYSLRGQRSIIKRYSPEVNFKIRTVSKKQIKETAEILPQPCPVYHHNIDIVNKTSFIDSGIIYVDEDRRKFMSRKREQIRRFKLAKYFDALKATIPQQRKDEQMSKRVILERSTIFIRSLFRRELFLKEVVNTLKKRSYKLQTIISRLEDRLVHLQSL